jgi:hypothetical protein
MSSQQLLVTFDAMEAQEVCSKLNRGGIKCNLNSSPRISANGSSTEQFTISVAFQDYSAAKQILKKKTQQDLDRWKFVSDPWAIIILVFLCIMTLIKFITAIF